MSLVPSVGKSRLNVGLLRRSKSVPRKVRPQDLVPKAAAALEVGLVLKG